MALPGRLLRPSAKAVVCSWRGSLTAGRVTRESGSELLTANPALQETHKTLDRPCLRLTLSLSAGLFRFPERRMHDFLYSDPVSDKTPWFGAFSGELTQADRHALEAAQLDVYEDGEGAPDAKWATDDPPNHDKPFQVVGMKAADGFEAEGKIVDALGRRPTDLSVRRGSQNA